MPNCGPANQVPVHSSHNQKPSAAQLQHVVDRIAGQLPSWKAKLMNKTGRLAFVKSVLGAIPLHQLLVYAAPKKSLT
jgi:hypothetical protein